MKKISLNKFCSLGLLLFTSQVVYSQDENPVDFDRLKYTHSYSEALSSAKETGKPVFINFYAKWAGPCIIMEKMIFSDEQFANWMNDRFVNLFVDTKSKEGKELCSRYGIDSFARYLVVDNNGVEIQPIYGGDSLPDFQNKVALALSEKHSFAAAKQALDKEGCNKSTLRTYLNAALVAGRFDGFDSLRTEYFNLISNDEYFDSINWRILSTDRSRQSNLFSYIVENRGVASEKVGKKTIDSFIERAFGRDVLSAASTDKRSPEEVMQLIEEVQKAGVEESSLIFTVAEIGRLRACRRFNELFEYLEKSDSVLAESSGLRTSIELTFTFPDLTDNERALVVDYLKKRAESLKGMRSSSRLLAIVDALTPTEDGIVFNEDKSLAWLLAEAKKRNCKVFIDCYTTWCGPCRMLATKVFPQKKVGDYFNKEFVCAKIDMEQGEGPDIGRRYGVSAFPTMLFLNPDGSVALRVTGYRSGDKLLEEAKSVVEGK